MPYRSKNFPNGEKILRTVDNLVAQTRWWAMIFFVRDDVVDLKI